MEGGEGSIWDFKSVVTFYAEKVNSVALEGVKVSPAGVPCGGVFLRANLLWLGFCVYFHRREKSALRCGDSLLNKI